MVCTFGKYGINFLSSFAFENGPFQENLDLDLQILDAFKIIGFLFFAADFQLETFFILKLN